MISYSRFRALAMLLATAVLAPGASFASPVAAMPIPIGCTAVGNPIEPRAAAAPAFLPAQLEVRAPFEPTAFPSGERHYLIYELHLRNFAGEALELQRIEVVDASTYGTSLAAFGADEIGPLVSPRNHGLSADALLDSRQLGVDQGTVVFVCLAFEPGVTVPARLRHRVFLKDGFAEGPAISTRSTPLQVLAPPVAGPDWVAAGGPGNTSHHRVGLLVVGGNARISRRHATDWKRMLDGATFAGDPIHVRSHHAYGEPVFAVADATVVIAKDGQPDNIPRTAKGFRTALPVTMETIAGNAVVLDLGNDQYAFYAHLAPGSVRVKAGDRVTQGQVLGRIGNSGDSREPHLHFDVSDSPDLLAGEGLPYLIDQYELRLPGDMRDARTDELPVMDMRVDFKPSRTKTD